MGCVESRLESNLQPNVFEVVSVYEHGQRQRASHLEVTDTHIIQYIKGRVPIRWPLSCLRRYGFDAEKFSFEAGRRCPTGPGIYYFKCRRAEALFNVLQAQIQNNAEDLTSRDFIANPEARDITRAESRASGVIDSQGYLETLPRTLTRPLNNNIFTGSITTPPLSAPPGVNGGIPGLSCFPNLPRTGSVRNVTTPTSLTPPVSGRLNELELRSLSILTLEERDASNISTSPMNESLLRKSLSPNESKKSGLLSNIDRSVKHTNQDRTSPCSNLTSERRLSSPYHGDRPHSFHNPSEREIYLNVDSLQSSHQANSSHNNYPESGKNQQQPVYINVDTDLRRDRDRVYANLIIEKDTPYTPSRITHNTPFPSWSGSHFKPTTPMISSGRQNSQINYIQVDLDRGSDSSHVGPLSPFNSGSPLVNEFPRVAESEGYATIDFDKTEALISTAKAAAQWETRADGSRRTRHNSTISAVSPTGKNNSTLLE